MKKLKLIPFLFLLVLSSCTSFSKQAERDWIAFEEKQRKARLPTVVIDAGHGGEDMGTHSLKPPTYQEKHLALITAKMVNHYLKQMGYRTAMTRDEDIFIPLKERAMIANEQEPKVFVSVHYNSAPSKAAHGIEVYYYNSDKDTLRTKKSKDLAKLVLDETLVHTEAKSRGVKHGNFAVIRETKMPAILVEGGFLTNAAEREKIKDHKYLKRLAYGIAAGVQAFLKRV